MTKKNYLSEKEKKQRHDRLAELDGETFSMKCLKIHFS